MTSLRVMAFTWMISRRFFRSEELKIDMSWLKSIWGLMLRIWTLESPARRGRVTRVVISRSPEKSLKTMGQRWAETQIWLKAHSYNHYYGRTCSVRQE